MILSLLVEGMSERAIARTVKVNPLTVSKLLVDAGNACAKFHDSAVRGVTAQRVQCDEIWTFCYAKQKNVASSKAAPANAGDVWTWTALDSDSKLIISYTVGDRSVATAVEFMHDLKDRLANRVQLTTDGHRAYLHAVEDAFGADVDYAQLVKLYGEDYHPGQTLQPGQFQRLDQEQDQRQAQETVNQHFPRRTSQPHFEDVAATVYAAHQCLFQEDRNHVHACSLYTVFL